MQKRAQMPITLEDNPNLEREMGPNERAFKINATNEIVAVPSHWSDDKVENYFAEQQAQKESSNAKLLADNPDVAAALPEDYYGKHFESPLSMVPTKQKQTPDFIYEGIEDRARAFNVAFKSQLGFENRGYSGELDKEMMKKYPVAALTGGLVEQLPMMMATMGLGEAVGVAKVGSAAGKFVAAKVPANIAYMAGKATTHIVNGILQGGLFGGVSEGIRQIVKQHPDAAKLGEEVLKNGLMFAPYSAAGLITSKTVGTAAVVGVTYALGKAQGQPENENLLNSIAMGALHHVMSGGKDVEAEFPKDLQPKEGINVNPPKEDVVFIGTQQSFKKGGKEKYFVDILYGDRKGSTVIFDPKKYKLTGIREDVTEKLPEALSKYLVNVNVTPEMKNATESGLPEIKVDSSNVSRETEVNKESVSAVRETLTAYVQEKNHIVDKNVAADIVDQHLSQRIKEVLARIESEKSEVKPVSGEIEPNAVEIPEVKVTDQVPTEKQAQPRKNTLNDEEVKWLTSMEQHLFEGESPKLSGVDGEANRHRSESSNPNWYQEISKNNKKKDIIVLIRKAVDGDKITKSQESKLRQAIESAKVDSESKGWHNAIHGKMEDVDNEIASQRSKIADGETERRSSFDDGVQAGIAEGKKNGAGEEIFGDEGSILDPIEKSDMPVKIKTERQHIDELKVLNDDVLKALKDVKDQTITNEQYLEIYTRVRAEKKRLSEEFDLQQEKHTPEEVVLSSKELTTELIKDIVKDTSWIKEEKIVTPEFGSENKIFTKESKDSASRNLSNKSKRLSSGIDPTAMVDLVKIGGYYVEGGMREFGKWSEKMVEELGDAIKPHLQNIWDNVSKEIEAKKLTKTEVQKTTENENAKTPRTEVKEGSSEPQRLEQGTESGVHVWNNEKNGMESEGGEVKTRGLSLSVEENAIHEGLVKDFGNLPTYKTRNMSEVAVRVSDFINNDYDKAKKIAFGEIPEEGDIRAQEMFTGLQIKAIAEGDVDTLREMGLSEEASEMATEAGQRVKALDIGKDNRSPVEAIKEVKEARTAEVEKKIGKDAVKVEKKKAMTDIKKSIKEEAKKMDWQGFLDSITC